MSRLGRSFRQRGVGSGRTLIQRAIASLRARGSDAHLWLPGGDVRTYGPELVVNGGPFVNTDGWGGSGADITQSVVSGSLQMVRGAGGVVGAPTQTISGLTPGSTYNVRVTGVVGISNCNYPAGNQSIAVGLNSFSFVASLTSHVFGFWPFSTNSTSSISFISVREILTITPTITNGLTTGNYLESTGKTLATVDNPTGLVLDALGTVGAELVTNGGFDTDAMTWNVQSGATQAAVNGELEIVGTASGSRSEKSIVLVADKTYVASGVLRRGTTAAATVNIVLLRGAAGGYATIGVVGSTANTTNTPVRFVFKASGSDAIIQLNNGGVGTAYFDNISVREVTGIHLTQGTTANKPLLRRGLTNLLTYSSDFSNAAWGKFAATSATANSVTISNTYTSGIYQQRAFSVGVPVTAAFVVSGTPGVTVNLNITDVGGAFPATNLQVVLSATPTLYAVNRIITQVSCTAQLTDYGTATTVTCGGIALFQGSYTAAQILAAGGIPTTTTAAASNPDAGRYFWSFDGSNDSLALGSVPFQMGDDHVIIAAAACTDANVSYVFGVKGDNSRSAGSIVYANGKAEAYWFNGSAVELIAPTASSDMTVSTAVRRVNNRQLRINGVMVAESNTVLSDTAPMVAAYIGGSSATDATVLLSTNQFTGTTGPVLAIKGTVSDSDLLMYERLVAALTPNGPVF